MECYATPLAVNFISLLFSILSEYNMNETAILNMIENHENNSGIIFESETHEALIDREFIIIRERKTEEFHQTLLIENTIQKIGNLRHLNKMPKTFIMLIFFEII